MVEAYFPVVESDKSTEVRPFHRQSDNNLVRPSSDYLSLVIIIIIVVGVLVFVVVFIIIV
jgi:hypothetical protein